MKSEFKELCEMLLEDDEVNTFDEVDTMIHELMDEFEELGLDFDSEDEDLNEKVSKTPAELKRKKRLALKKKKKLIRKIGRGEFNKRKRKAKLKRKKSSFKRKTKLAKKKRDRSASGKKAARLTKRRQKMSR